MNSAVSVWEPSTVAGISNALVGGGTPAREVPSLWNGGIPWVTPGELTNLKGKYLETTAETISPSGLSSSGARLLPENALLVTTRATLGSVALTKGPIATNQGFRSIVFKGDAHPDFYYHLFRTLKREMERRASGTTFLEISGKQFAEIDVPLPPINEQRRIAEILDTVDAAIQSAEAITDKLRQMKVGVIASAIGVRDQSQVMEAALIGTPMNGIYKPAHLIGRGTLLVGQTAIAKDRHVVPGLARRAVVTSSELNRFGLVLGDVLVSRVFATLEGVGQPGLVDEASEPAVYESNMMRLRYDPSKADPYFMFLTLQLPSARGHIVRHANLSNQASISQKVLTKLPVWLPGIDEQHAISHRIRSIDARIAAEEELFRKLSGVRLGLMSDVLSGDVRVPLETVK